ncbi:uncharacterized protein LOC113358808 [Papaver somniferum]|uniref:uncharacterized protein LOC113358808 n=1 Tax=Papaver somniferum TaxID=3469 RepID=UPI000E6FD73E|nr:uncharacterized protein LOC113358808 [Papaver somniferum]
MNGKHEIYILYPWHWQQLSVDLYGKKGALDSLKTKKRTPEQLAIDITRHFACWHPERNQKNAISRKQQTLNNSWTLPSTNTNKINCDASWLSEITNAGFGFILRNWTGTFKAAAMGSCRTFSPEEVEVVSLLRATQWVVLHNIQNLVIEGDNQETINYLQGKDSTVKWQCLATLEEVKLLADQLVSFLGFQYVDRRANKVADLLAKKGRSTSNTTFWNDQSPSFLIPSISFDTVKAYEMCNLNDNISVTF